MSFFIIVATDLNEEKAENLSQSLVGALSKHPEVRDKTVSHYKINLCHPRDSEGYYL